MTSVNPTVGLAAVNGIELAYELRGRGRPLVLLHGGFGAAEMFGPNIAALAAAGRSSGWTCSRTDAPRRSTGRCASRRWPTTSVR